jgi:AcrR family transcriptional regulator
MDANPEWQSGRSKRMIDESASRSRAELRREHLLQTARSLFIAQGFHQTGMAQISAASEIKMGQIYRDFESKEDIIAAICERKVAAWLEEDVLAGAVQVGDTRAVRDWLDRFLRSDEPLEECRLMSEIIAESGRNARIAQLSSTVDRKVRDSLTAALTAISPHADCSDARDPLIDFILALGLGIMIRRTFDPELKVEPLFRYVSAVIDERIQSLSQ